MRLKSFLFLFSTFFFLPTAVYAGNEFSTAYEITYEVKENGQTFVRQNIQLTNLTTNFYVSEYTLNFGTEEITGISARDDFGPLLVDVKKGVDLTQIHVAFNEKVVGQGRTLNWTLQYQSSDIAKKVGRIWEIDIPRMAQEEKPTSYNVSLIVPNSFGQPAYVWPKPRSAYFWTMTEGAREGITLAFGDWQQYAFNLSYHLENSQIGPGQTFIALPPDTPYQKIILDRIEPMPQDIIVDADGNWLASYFLLPTQKKEIKVKGWAKIFLKPQADYPRQDKKFIDNYLQPQKYWEQTPEIKKLAQQLKTPREIYHYVVEKLNYDYERANRENTVRLGAAKALAQPEKAICMEFTDLFIALARSAGIPAREINGYAYTSNSKLKPLSLLTDVLHSWPEYWDEQSQLWVQLDPTWAKTSLSNYFDHFDFNHLTFVKHGVSSSQPFSAGSYKDKKGGKDVLVDFSSDFPSLVVNAPKVQLNFPTVMIAGLPVNGQIIINNTNKVALYNLNVNLYSPLEPKTSVFNLTSLPPLTTRKLDIKLNNSDPFLNAENPVRVKVNEEKYDAKIRVIALPILILPLFFLFWLLIWLIKKLAVVLRSTLTT